MASNHTAPLVPKVLLGPVGHLSIRFSHVKNVKFKSCCPELGAFVPLAMREGSFGVTSQGGALLAPGGWTPGMLLSVLQGTERH